MEDLLISKYLPSKNADDILNYIKENSLELNDIEDIFEDAISHGSSKVFFKLKEDYDLNVRQSYIFKAATGGNLEIFKYIVEKLQGKFVVEEQIHDALWNAVNNNHKDIIDYILKVYDLDINNVIDLNNVCTLASLYNDEDLLNYLKFLVSKGLDKKITRMSVTDTVGPEQLIRHDKIKSLEYMIKDNEEFLPLWLHYANTCGSKEMFNLILSNIQKK